MARWIVAGVLLAVLIALIVVDTSSLEGNLGGPPPAQVAAAGAPSVAGGAAAEAPAVGTPAAAAPQNPELPDVLEPRPKLDVACAKVKESLRAAKGDAFVVTLGDSILTKVTEDQFAATCTAVEALPVAEQIAKLEALAAGTAATP
jgi:hypothetical protein